MTAKLLMSQQAIDQDRGKWQDIRRSGITASEIASILGIAPGTHGSAFKLFVAKTTGENFEADSAEMRRGRYLEPYVADVFAEDHPYLTVIDGGLYASEERPWQMATFDRLALDPSVLGIPESELEASISDRGWIMSRSMPVQIKTSATREGWGEPGTKDIPGYYLAQAIWEMDVRDAEVAFVPVLFMQEWKVVTYIIERDADVEQDIELMREEAEAFLLRCLKDDPPPIDWTPATTEALKLIHPLREDESAYIPMGLARRYRRARAGRQAAARRLAQAENEIRARAGGAKYVYAKDRTGSEHKVWTRSVHSRETIDSGLLRQRYPVIAKEVTRTSTVDAVYPGGWSKDSEDET